ncbi:MAG: alcohol dehydrogenase catalytic domain-containing protein [Anaerolineaceae bacterium]|nr:alcohol dehydrogenase catalytic domain-containing protein [Anaerolineaceae bacterium]
MKAAIWYGHRDLRVSETHEPDVKPGHVKVRVAWAGICGTDRHEYNGPVFIPVTKPNRLTGRVAPLILGHEFTGIITEVGEGVTGWKIGDRVTASGNLVCGKCEWCKSGRINLCERLAFNGIGDDGCFAEYIVVPSYQLFKIPSNVSLEKAVLTEPLACGVHSTKLIGDIAGKDVVVIGPGIIGMSCLIAAKHNGAKRVLVAGVGNKSEAIVRQFGADEYVDVTKTDLVEFVRTWTNGRMAEVVYECVGLEQTLENAVNCSRNAAKIMIMGVYEKPPKFPMNLFQEGERILLSSQAYNDELAIVLDWMSKEDEQYLDLITRRITLDRITEDGFEELMAHNDRHVKIAIKIANLE